MRNKEEIPEISEWLKEQPVRVRKTCENARAIILLSQQPEVKRYLEKLKTEENYSPEEIEEASLHHRWLALKSRQIREGLEPTELGALMEAYDQLSPLFLKIKAVSSQNRSLRGFLNDTPGQRALMEIIVACLEEVKLGNFPNEEEIDTKIHKAIESGRVTEGQGWLG